MKETSLGYCGLNCETCPIVIATTNNDNKLRQQISEEWSKLYAEYIGKKELKLEDINCEGCRSNDNCFIGCENCTIRKCCQDKKLITCASCVEYDKCEMLNGFLTVPAHKSAKENLDKIRMSK